MLRISDFKISLLGWAFTASFFSVVLLVGSVVFLVVQNSGEVDMHWQDFEKNIFAKQAIATDMQEAIGYGNMIHQFKNYVLRQDEKRISKIEAGVKKTLASISAYRALGTNTKEEEALRAIEGVVRQYQTNIAVVESMATTGATANEIDKAVKISDSPAIEGREILNIEIAAAVTQKSVQLKSVLGKLNRTNTYGLGAVVLILFSMACMNLWWTRLHLIKPINTTTNIMTRLAAGDLDVLIENVTWQNEIGDMSKAVLVFKENAIVAKQLEEDIIAREAQVKVEKNRYMAQLADDFQSSVGDVVASVSSAAIQLKSSATTLLEEAEESNRRANNVSAASDQAASNVQTVATATEEMDASVRQISQHASHASNVAANAVKQAEGTHVTVSQLVGAVTKINDVVKLITDIAEQTNLLALNATIEAARAGEAGKGFAVVANEVKSLATQTARATDEIGAQIGDIQNVTKDAANALENISKTIEEINGATQAISTAVDEQTSTTQEIARNVADAALGTSEVSTNIQRVSNSAGRTGGHARQIVASSTDLNVQSGNLQSAVGKFLTEIRNG